MKQLLLFFALMAVPAFADTVQPATNRAITYSGRWVQSGSEATAAGAGQRFRFVVKGSRCALLVKGAFLPAAVSVRVNASAWKRYTVGAAGTTIPLSVPASLARAGGMAVEAVVAVVSDLDAWASPLGRFTLSGVSLPPGMTLAAWPYPSRRVLFVGDSISIGWNLSGTTSDAAMAFPSLLADRLGIDALTAAFEGIGYVTKVGTVAPVAIKDFVDQSTRGTAWTPPAISSVVVCLGSNDGHASNADIHRAATEAVLNWRKKWPDADVFILPPFDGECRSALASVVTDLKDPKVRWLDTQGWITTADTSDYLHPTAAGNAKIAARLALALK